jgi:MFS transporter, DHA1 family, inner membrane transport protein
MSDKAPLPSQKQHGRFFILSVALNGYAEQSLNLLLGLFLIDIAVTFRVSVGAASQLALISSFAAIFMGLIMGVLSVRFSHKSLLLIGATIVTVGVLGCFFAPNFTFMQIFYPLDGVGSVIVVAMGYALFGRFLSLEKRAKATGWLVASGTLAFVIGAPIAGFIAGASSWRNSLLWFFLPISIAGLILAYFHVPSTPREKQNPIAKESYLSSFKLVLTNRSAAAVLPVSAFWVVAQIWSLYGLTFYRTRFLVSLEYTSLILVVLALLLAIGGVFGGRLVDRFGRQRLAILCCGITVLLRVVFIFIPFFWIVLILDLASAFVGGIGTAAAYNLVLEQLPQARGTMMSLTGMAGYLGAIIGVIIGGAVLDRFTSLTSNGPILDPTSFQVLVPIISAFGFVSIILNYLFIKDPCRK